MSGAGDTLPRSLWLGVAATAASLVVTAERSASIDGRVVAYRDDGAALLGGVALLALALAARSLGQRDEDHGAAWGVLLISAAVAAYRLGHGLGWWI